MILGKAKSLPGSHYENSPLQDNMGGSIVMVVPKINGLYTQMDDN